jgi:hypothetical protein
VLEFERPTEAVKNKSDMGYVDRHGLWKRKRFGATKRDGTDLRLDKKTNDNYCAINYLDQKVVEEKPTRRELKDDLVDFKSTFREVLAEEKIIVFDEETEKNTEINNAPLELGAQINWWKAN